MMRFWMLLIVILLCQSMVRAEEIVDGIAAIVGNEIILRTEVEETLNSYLLQNRQTMSPKEKNQIRQMILKQLINYKLLIMQAEKDSVEVTRQEIEQSVDYRINNLIQYFGAEDRLKSALSEEGLTLRELRKQYLEEAQAQLISDRMKMEKTQNVTVSSIEVRDFFNEYRDSLQQQQEAFKVSYLFLSVQDRFPEMAKQYSQHTASAQNGGDLGWLKKDDMLDQIAAEINNLNLFEISRIIITQAGWHLVQIQAIDTLNNRYKLRHILFSPPQLDTALFAEKIELIRKELQVNANDLLAKYKQLQDLRKRIVEGEEFDSLVSQFSEDPISKEQGGNVGWRALEDFKTLFPDKYDMIIQLKVGDLSPVLQTLEGFYVMKILDHQGKRSLTLEDDWSIVERYAEDYKKNKLFQEWIDRIADNYFIDIKVDYN